MNTIYIIPIEPIDQRYTKQWYDNIPTLINEKIQEYNLDYTVTTIDGVTVEDKTTSGAFLDFGKTNEYKASQTAHVSELFSKGLILPGDKFLITDAWNFIVTPIKYMSELLDIPVEIHGIWHAGAYDPTDILGLKMSKPWPHLQEKAWYMACDYNYFGTNFHRNIFLHNLEIPDIYHNKAIRSGQPHNPIVEQLQPYYNTPKQNTVMWPHRYNEDKQPEIIENLDLRPYSVLITQQLDLSKEKYYEAMGQAKAVFSCSLHENLGISMMEGCLAGAIPIVPDRASYSEMLKDCDVYIDWEYLSNNLEVVYKYFPDAKYIFNTRNVDDWIRSLKKHHSMLTQDEIEKSGWHFVDEEERREYYDNHTKKVLNFFKDKREGSAIELRI